MQSVENHFVKMTSSKKNFDEFYSADQKLLEEVENIAWYAPGEILNKIESKLFFVP